MPEEKKSLYLCKSCKKTIQATWTKGFLGGYSWKIDNRCPHCNAATSIPKNFQPVLCPHCDTLVEDIGNGLCISCEKPLAKQLFSRKVKCPHCSMLSKVKHEQEGDVMCPFCQKKFDASKLPTDATPDDEPQLIRLPDVAGLLGGEEKQLVWKHPVDAFPFKSRMIVTEGTYAVLLQDGRCKHICSAGSYLLSDCKLDTNAKFDVAFADSDVAFTTSILCVPQTLPAITFGFATPPTKSPRNEDSFSVVAVNANAELVVADAQAFAAFAGFTPATLDTLVKDNGKLIVLLRDLGKEVMQRYLVTEFADKDPKDLPMYQLSIAHYMQTEMSTLLQSKAGLKVNRLSFNNGTPSVTFEANPLTTLLKQARMTRSFSGDATLYMPGHPEQKATISVKGQYALDVSDKERFFSRPEAQQLEALIKDSQLDEDYQQPCEDYFGSLVSPADVSAILQSEAQRLVNDGTISDLRDANQYLSLSGLVKMRLDEKLRLNGLGMYSLSMDLPAVIVSKALADKYNLPEKQRQLRNAVQEPLTLTTAPVDIHAPGNDHTRKIQAVFKGQCLMRVSDEYTFFADSVADDFLHSDRPIAKPEVTAKYASLLNPLFGDVLRSVIQSVVNNLNADIRDINVLTANVKSSIIASMSMRAGVYGLSLASIDMLPTDVIFTSPTLLQQGSVESAISGDELRRKLEELENNHVIFTAQEDGRVKIAKNGVEIEVLKNDDLVAEAHSQFAAKAENRTHEVNKVKIEHAAELDEMEDEATRLQQERNYAAQLRDLKHRFMMRDEALEQKIREDERLQNAQIAAEHRDRDNAFAKLLEAAENKKALNDIMHKIDESDLEWREKLDQYARMQKRTQVQDDAETARVQADTSVYTANANLGIQHQQDERFYGMVSKKIQLSAAEAELLERIKQYDEDRHERVTAANEARAERRSTLTFEQRLQDRREQVAQQMEQLQQQYDQVLALRDKDEKLAQLQMDFDKYALQIQAYNNYITTRYGAEVAMEASRQATKAAEAKYGAEAATAYAAMEAMRLDAQTKREDSIAARADALQKDMMDIIEALELARIDVDKTRVIEDGKVGVEKARSEAQQKAAEAKIVEAKAAEAKTNERIQGLISGMKGIRDSINSLRGRVRKLEEEVNKPRTVTPPTPPTSVNAGFKVCPYCKMTIPASATMCPHCYSQQ